MKSFLISDCFPFVKVPIITPEMIIKQAEELMKKYNIPKENMVVDRSTLKFCFGFNGPVESK